MIRDRIIFWQVSPSPHQAPFVREIAALLPPGRAVGVFQRSPSAARMAMGWGAANYGATKIIMAPDDGTTEAVLASEPERSVHIFSSITHAPQISRALRRAVADPRLMIGLLSEARDWRGLKGLGRTLHSLWHERRYQERVNFVLAIGGNGVGWYRRCGYPEKKIYPFCYVAEPSGPAEGEITAARDQQQSQSTNYEQQFQILFIGQLILRKRVDLLLDALGQIECSNLQVSIIGSGNEGDRLERQAARRKLENKVVFLGPRSNKEVRNLLAKVDLFVLPSHWDGWGAVVNEALMAGVPVICSDWCGASSLIRPGWNGDVFRSGSVHDLATALRIWINRGKLPPDRREAIRAWSQCIAGPEIARYVLDVVAFVDNCQGVRPRPPWSVAI